MAPQKREMTDSERLVYIETILEGMEEKLEGLPSQAETLVRLQEFRSSVTHQIWDEEGSRIERALRLAESTAAAQSTMETRLWTAVTGLVIMFAGACISAYVALEKLEISHVLRR